MDWKTAFEILAIEATNDKQKIKDAYAKTMERYNAGQISEKWLNIHYAYKAAMEYAENPGAKDGGAGTASAEKSTGRSFTDTSQPREAGTREQQMEQLLQYVQQTMTEPERSEILWVFGRLREMKNYPGTQLYSLWDALLQSREFKKNSGTKVVLEYLLCAAAKMQFDYPTAEMLCEYFSDLEVRLAEDGAESESELACRIEERMEAVCESAKRSAPYEYTPYAQPQKKKRGCLVSLFILCGLIVLTLIIAVGVLSTRKSQLYSEKEARSRIIEYLHEKYPELQVEEDDLRIYELSGYSYRSGESELLGYSGRWTTGEIQFLMWKDEETKEKKFFCADNVQEEKICEDLQAQLLAQLGYEEGILYLSAEGNRVISELLDTMGNGACFHTAYEGDLAEFFEKERKEREILLKVFEAYQDTISGTNASDLAVNGRAALYLRDKEVATVRERLALGEATGYETFEKVLTPLAQSYELSLECVVLPQDFYDKIDVVKEQDSSLEYQLGKGGYSYTVDEAPLIAPLVLAWYYSENTDYEAKLYTQRAEEAQDGIWVMGDTAGTAVAKSGGSGRLAQAMQGNTGCPNVLFETCDLQAEAKETLEAEGVRTDSTWNLRMTGDYVRGYAILDLEKLGLNENIRGVALTECREEPSCETFDISMQIDDAASGLFRCVYLEDGLLIVPATFLNEEGTILTLAY